MTPPNDLDQALATAVGEFVRRLIDNTVARTEPLYVRRYGPHTVTMYRDGRRTCLTAQRYPGEETFAPTPYELLQMGEEMPLLYKPELSWAQAALLGSAGLVVYNWMNAMIGPMR